MWKFEAIAANPQAAKVTERDPTVLNPDSIDIVFGNCVWKH